eukprot:g10701.t1
MARVLGFLMLPFALAKPSLRAPDVYVDTVQCTGSGSLPTEPVCFGGSVLVENFNIHVTSYDVGGLLKPCMAAHCLLLLLCSQLLIIVDQLGEA